MTYEEDEDDIQGDEEPLNRLHRDFVDRQLKKNTRKELLSTSSSAKLARQSKDPKYDRNSHGELGIKRKYTTIQPFPKTEHEKIALIKKLPQWLEDNPNEMLLEAFPLSFGYSPYEFFTKAKEGECEEYSRGVEAAREIMSGRTHEKLLSDTQHLRNLFELNNSRTQDWQLRKREASKATDNKGPQVVVIEKYPNSDMVPEKE